MNLRKRINDQLESHQMVEDVTWTNEHAVLTMHDGEKVWVERDTENMMIKDALTQISDIYGD